ncbi:MAG: HIT domain-containing protein [Nanoarchaeota archaeon]|nr:HIT domain-containing protein [Nanoarchaeota archaeon]
MENECVFCRIVSKNLKSYPIYEDNNILAVLDINPATAGHTLIIPKVHYNTLYDMPQDQYLYMLTIARAIAFAMLLVQGAKNVDILYTSELVKGNITPHAILHLIPRYENDALSYTWQPQRMSEDELSALASKISSAINSVKEGVKPAAQEKTAVQEVKAVEKQEEKPVEKKIELKPKPVVY